MVPALGHDHGREAQANPVANSLTDPDADMTLFDALLLIAVLAAAAGVVARNMTAAALLGSNAFTYTLSALGVPFSFVLWMAVDLAAVLCIIHPAMTRRDTAVLALFAPAWALYQIEAEWPTAASKAIVSAQMLLTFPVMRTLSASRHWVARMRERDDLRMVAA